MSKFKNLEPWGKKHYKQHIMELRPKKCENCSHDTEFVEIKELDEENLAVVWKCKGGCDRTGIKGMSVELWASIPKVIDNMDFEEYYST